MGDGKRNTWYGRILSWVSLGPENDANSYDIEDTEEVDPERPWRTTSTLARRSAIRNRKSKSKKPSRDPSLVERISACSTIFNYFHPWRNINFDKLIENLPNEAMRIIFDASRSGHREQWEKVLSIPEYGKWINAADLMTALHIACAFGHTEIAQLLLSRGADPCALDQTECITPLICAAVIGNEEIMSMLIAHDADINYGLDAENQNITSLETIGGNNHVHQISFRIDFPEPEQETHTALMWAVKARNFHSVQYLLKRGAKLAGTKVNWRTPLHEAAYLGDADILKLLIDHEKKTGKIQSLELRGGAFQNTALHVAVGESHANCVEFLLASGANPDKQNMRGQTPLHIAAKTKDYETIQMLIKAGADVNHQDTSGKTPLHLCVPVSRHAFSGDAIVECMEVLLNNDADVDIQDENGHTVFHIAVDNKLSSVVPILLKHGADLTLCVKSGQSGLELLVKKMPHAIRYVKESLDLAIKVAKKETTDPRCKLAFDFRAIIPTVEKRNSTTFLFKKETELLMSFCSTGHKEILAHPLIEAFLILKWQKVNKYFYLSFLANLLMVILYSTFLVQFYSVKCPLKKSCIYPKIDECEVCQVGNSTTTATSNILSVDVIILWWTLMGLVVGFCLKEVFQMILLSPKRYFTFAENYAQITFGIIAISTMIPFVYIRRLGEDSCSCYCLGCKDYVLASVGIIVSWFMILLRVGKFPRLGLYVHMLFKVVTNFGLFVAAYSCILIAFSLSTGILFNEEYANIFQSILSTLVMMTGEISISFSPTYNDTIADSFPKVWIGDFSSLVFSARYVMFTFFVLMVTIVLMNLLVGLAVSDIQGLQDGAKLDRLKRLVFAISQLEIIFTTHFMNVLPKLWKFRMQKWALLIQKDNMNVYVFQPYNPADTRLPHSLQIEALNIVEKREDQRRASKGITDFEIKQLLEKVQSIENILKNSSNQQTNVREKINTLQVNPH